VPRYLNRNDAADLLRSEFGSVASSYLGQLTRAGDGPPHKISGRYVMYEPEALLAWAESRLRDPEPRKVAGVTATT
jgi:hypothetical protein